MIIDQITEERRSAKAMVKKQKAIYVENKIHIVKVADALKKIEDKVIRAWIDFEINLSITGDKNVLKAIFSAFRKLGYQSDDRPTSKPQQSFHTRFNHPNMTVYSISHSHQTQCTRIKVGEKTETVDIYETVCE